MSYAPDTSVGHAPAWWRGAPAPEASRGGYLTGVLVAVAIGAVAVIRPGLVVPLAVLLVLVIGVLVLPPRTRMTIEQFGLLLLLILTSVFGRRFSYVQVGPLYATDFTLLVVGGLAIVRAAVGTGPPHI